jgi:hypothetical protein
MVGRCHEDEIMFCSMFVDKYYYIAAVGVSSLLGCYVLSMLPMLCYSVSSTRCVCAIIQHQERRCMLCYGRDSDSNPP